MKFLPKAFLLILLALSGCVPFLPPVGGESLAANLVGKTVALVMVRDDGEKKIYCSGEWVSNVEILTADHCTRKVAMGDALLYAVQDDVTTTLAGDVAITPRTAYLEYRDEKHDLALLLAGAAAPLEHGVAKVAPYSPAAGQAAYAMGNPLGAGWSFSAGVIAQIRYVNTGEDQIWYVQATTPVSPGSSGGGLYDAQGYLLGVTRMVYPRGENMNFFIHRDHIAAFIENAHAGHGAPSGA